MILFLFVDYDFEERYFYNPKVSLVRQKKTVTQKIQYNSRHARQAVGTYELPRSRSKEVPHVQERSIVSDSV